MTKNFRDYIVTEDPELVEALRAKFHEVGSMDLPQHAYALGLYPPGWEEGQKHSISEVIPPGHEGEPLLVWDVGLESPGVDDQEPEAYDDDDDDNPWAGIVPISVNRPADDTNDQ